MLTSQPIVDYALLRPRQVVERRTAMPVAYWGMGILEWHGLQNPMGLDGVKADAMARRWARKFGGLVVPHLFWGENRQDIVELATAPAYPDKEDTKENQHGPIVRKIMKIDQNEIETEGARDKVRGYNPWKDLVLHSLFTLQTLGFKAAVVIPGHYPLIDPAAEVAKMYQEIGGAMAVLVLHDMMYPAKDGYAGDHAAAFETSMMMALYPELTDLNELDADLSHPNIGLFGRDPRTHASAEYGEQILAAFDEIVKAFLVENKLM